MSGERIKVLILFPGSRFYIVIVLHSIPTKIVEHLYTNSGITASPLPSLVKSFPNHPR